MSIETIAKVDDPDWPDYVRRVEPRFIPTAPADEHSPACECSDCVIERRLWHSFMAEDGVCDCEECAASTGPP